MTTNQFFVCEEYLNFPQKDFTECMYNNSSAGEMYGGGIKTNFFCSQIINANGVAVQLLFYL